MTSVAEAAPGLLRLLGGAAAAKVLVMGLSGLVGILTSRLILSSYGTEAYAQYGLLASLPGLIPFADLGLASVVLTAVSASADPRTDLGLRRTLTTAFRMLSLSGLTVAGVGIAITLLGAWPLLLGDVVTRPGGELATLLSMLILAAMLPVAVGTRVLIGMGRTTTTIAVQALVGPFVLLSVLVTVWLAVPAGDFLAVFSYLGNALVPIICLVLVARLLSPQLRNAVRDIPRLKAVPNVPFLAMAWPFLIQMLVLPLAMQSDRLLLSHLSSATELAKYNLAAQLFGLIVQTIVAAGVALWPVFTRARATDTVRSPFGLVGWFLLGGVTGSGVLALLAPWIVAFISDGTLRFDGWLIGGFIAFVATQAANYPLGMYLTDPRGLRFQVVPILLMVPANLGLSVLLIPSLGAGGTILATALAVTLFQVLPNAWYVRRDLGRRRAELAAAVDAPVAAGAP